MDDHLIDIVDENNKPTGQRLPRSVVHANNVWHRAALVLIYRKTNNKIEILVHKRAASKDSSPNKIDPRIGGHVKSGETYEDAIVAEMKEELDLQINLGQLLKGPLVKETLSYEFFQYYFLEYNDSMGKLRPDPEEIQSINWMTVPEIEDSVKQNPEKWIRTIGPSLEIIKTIC